MAVVKVKINPRGAQKLLTSKAVQGHLNARAQRIADAAGDGFVVRERPERIKRYGVQVRTGDRAARRAQAETNALTRAIDAGR